jgi:hypothetical protein
MKKILAFVGLVLMLLAIASTSYYVFQLLKTPDSTTPLILGAIGFVISKFYENYKDRQTRLYDKKREVYQKLIMPYREVLINSVVNKGVEKQPEYILSKEQLTGAVEAAFDAVMFASDSVLKAYGDFRNVSLNEFADADAHLKGLAKFLGAIRKDLGNRFSSSDEVDMLKVFINMSSEEEKYFREKFKSYN